MIERLYVHNFRCLENFTLDFGGQRSAVLIGKNGAGKTTVVNSLRVFQKICRGPNRVKNVIEATDFTRHDKSRPMRFEIDVALGGARFKYSVSFEWPAEFYEARITEESLLKDGVEVFSRERSQVRLAGRAAFGLDWHVFALPVINEMPPEHSIKDIKEFFANMYLLEPIPSKAEGFSEKPETELGREAWNFASCLRALLQGKPKAYGIFDAYIRKVIPDFSSIEFKDRGKDGGSQLTVLFSFEQPQQTLSLDYDALSSGEKCLMLSAYIMAANSVRSAGDSAVVCVWDEPDNHLSISEVGHFIMDMRKMTNQNGQFIATTHHPETIRTFADENTFVLTRKSHFDPTVVKPLSAFSYSGDLIHALIRDEIIG